MGTQHKPGIFFSFRRPSGIVNLQPCNALSEGLRRLAESKELRPLIDKALAQGEDQVVGIFHSEEGRPLLLVVAAAPTRPAPEDE